MEKKTKTILKIGNSLGLSLSELRKLNLKPGSKVSVCFDGEKIIIGNDDYLGMLKPSGIDKELWDEFISVVISTKRFKNLAIEDKIIKAFEEAIKKFIEDEKHLYVKIKV